MTEIKRSIDIDAPSRCSLCNLKELVEGRSS